MEALLYNLISIKEAKRNSILIFHLELSTEMDLKADKYQIKGKHFQLSLLNFVRI